MDMELTIELSIGMIAREEVLETGGNLNAGRPISHENGYGDQYQADRNTCLKDNPADTEFISAARFVHACAPSGNFSGGRLAKAEDTRHGPRFGPWDRRGLPERARRDAEDVRPPLP